MVCETCWGSGRVKSLLYSSGDTVCPTCWGSGMIYKAEYKDPIIVPEGDTQIIPIIDGITMSEDELKLIRLLRKHGPKDMVYNFIRKLELAWDSVTDK